jgi:hypothetical protein
MTFAGEVQKRIIELNMDIQTQQETIVKKLDYLQLKGLLKTVDKLKYTKPIVFDYKPKKRKVRDEGIFNYNIHLSI